VLVYSRCEWNGRQCILVSVLYNFVSYTHWDRSARSTNHYLCSYGIMGNLCAALLIWMVKQSFVYACWGPDMSIAFVCVALPPTDNALRLTCLQCKTIGQSLGFHCTFIELLPVTCTIEENAWIISLLCLLVVCLFCVCLSNYLSVLLRDWRFDNSFYECRLSNWPVWLTQSQCFLLTGGLFEWQHSYFYIVLQF
jgi:hypothetical protein